MDGVIRAMDNPNLREPVRQVLRRIGTPDKFSDKEPQFIFLLANHNPKSTILLDEMQNMSDSEVFELKVALVKYKRYSLIHKTMFNLSDAKEEISRRLRCTGISQG